MQPLFAVSLFCHMVGDFVCAPPKIQRFKGRYWRGVLLHALLVLPVYLVVLPAFFGWLGLGAALLLWLLHSGVDAAFFRLGQRVAGYRAARMLGDQMAHLLCVVGVAAWLGAAAQGGGGLACSLAGSGAVVLFCSLQLALLQKLMMLDVFPALCPEKGFYQPFEQPVDALCGLLLLTAFALLGGWWAALGAAAAVALNFAGVVWLQGYPPVVWAVKSGLALLLAWGGAALL